MQCALMPANGADGGSAAWKQRRRRMQSWFGTRVWHHMLAAYQRALGVTIVRHGEQSRSPSERASIDALHNVGPVFQRLVALHMPWRDAPRRLDALYRTPAEAHRTGTVEQRALQAARDLLDRAMPGLAGGMGLGAAAEGQAAGQGAAVDAEQRGREEGAADRAVRAPPPEVYAPVAVMGEDESAAEGPHVDQAAGARRFATVFGRRRGELQLR